MDCLACQSVSFCEPQIKACVSSILRKVQYFGLLTPFCAINHFCTERCHSFFSSKWRYLSLQWNEFKPRPLKIVGAVHPTCPARWWLNCTPAESGSVEWSRIKKSRKKKEEKVGRYSVGDYAANAALRSAGEKGWKKGNGGRARRNPGWSIVSATCKCSSDNHWLISMAPWNSMGKRGT